MVLVDSSVWIESLRRDGDLAVKCAVESLLNEYEATLCSPVRLEVLGGARENEREDLNRHFSVLPYLSARETDFSRACELAWDLARAGVRAPWFDLLIAAIGLRVECRVYSLDNHFKLMSKHHTGIRLYEPGYGGMFAPDEGA